VVPVQEAMNTPTTGMEDQPSSMQQPGMAQDIGMSQQSMPQDGGMSQGGNGQSTDVREQVQQQARQAEMKLRDEMDRRTTEFGDQLTSVASAMRRGTEDLRTEGKDQAAMLMDRGAEQVDRLGRYLTDANGDKMMRDVEDFGRKRPGMLAFGGLALGFAAARFLRASSERRMNDSQWDQQTMYPTEVAYGDTTGIETMTTTMPTEIGGSATPSTMPAETGGG